MLGGLAAAGLLAVLAIFGASHQKAVEARLRAQFPPPGQLVDIGGRRLHILCKGDGPGPVVVIEAGAGNFSVHHWAVQDRVAKFARVCTYDRAGYGWSDPAPPRRSLDDRIEDLHALLHKADIPGPYVLAGHSMGGLLVQLYQQRYPQEVAGLVLIEASEPGSMFGTPIGRTLSAMGVGVSAGSAAVSVGLAPVIDVFSGLLKVPKGQPPAATLGFQAEPLRVRAEDLAFFGKPLKDVHLSAEPGSLGDLPLMVVTRGAPARAGNRPNSWTSAQTRMAALSTRGGLIVAEGSGHNVDIDRPDVAAEAIRKVVEMAREKAPA